MGLDFRKKPVTIQAALFDGKLVGEPIAPQQPSLGVRSFTCPDWFPAAVEERDGDPAAGEIVARGDKLLIGTLEGVMTANPGDWIIRGVKGELYPCKPDVFAATYEGA